MIPTEHHRVSELIVAVHSPAVCFLPLQNMAIALATAQHLLPTVLGLVWLAVPSLATMAGNTECCVQWGFGQ